LRDSAAFRYILEESLKNKHEIFSIYSTGEKLATGKNLMTLDLINNSSSSSESSSGNLKIINAQTAKTSILE
jgi:hypothetical protein